MEALMALCEEKHIDQLELLVESCVKSIKQLRTIREYQDDAARAYFIRTKAALDFDFFESIDEKDGIRYILGGGTSTLLFLPLALPAAFLVMMHYSAKDTGRDLKGEKRISLAVGIPLLLLSLLFEILSFANL